VFTQTAVHYGRFELRLCPLSDPSQQTAYKELSEACLDAHQLYLAPDSIQASFQRRLPSLIWVVEQRPERLQRNESSQHPEHQLQLALGLHPAMRTLASSSAAYI